MTSSTSNIMNCDKLSHTIKHVYLNASSVLISSHPVNLIHDHDVFTAHCPRRT